MCYGADVSKHFWCSMRTRIDGVHILQTMNLVVRPMKVGERSAKQPTKPVN